MARKQVSTRTIARTTKHTTAARCPLASVALGRTMTGTYRLAVLSSTLPFLTLFVRSSLSQVNCLVVIFSPVSAI